MVPRASEGSASWASRTTSWYQAGKSWSCLGSAMDGRIAERVGPVATTSGRRYLDCRGPEDAGGLPAVRDAERGRGGRGPAMRSQHVGLRVDRRRRQLDPGGVPIPGDRRGRVPGPRGPDPRRMGRASDGPAYEPPGPLGVPRRAEAGPVALSPAETELRGGLFPVNPSPEVYTEFRTFVCVGVGPLFFRGRWTWRGRWRRWWRPPASSWWMSRSAVRRDVGSSASRSTARAAWTSGRSPWSASGSRGAWTWRVSSRGRTRWR